MTKNKSEPIVKVKNISKSFGGVKALRSGSFNLNSGEIISIVGANGAGKSTLIKLVSGSLVPDSGSIEINGVEVPRSSHSVSHMREKGVEVVYQDLALVPNMTAPYNLFLGARHVNGGFLLMKKKCEIKLVKFYLN